MKVQSLRAQVAQKDLFISDLLDRIAIVECEVRRILHCVFPVCFSFWCGELSMCAMCLCGLLTSLRPHCQFDMSSDCGSLHVPRLTALFPVSSFPE